jgi:hypothetical protein
MIPLGMRSSWRDGASSALGTRGSPEDVGKAKDSSRRVAKVVFATTEGAVGYSADFAPVVKAAHSGLKTPAGQVTFHPISNSVRWPKQPRRLRPAWPRCGTSTGPVTDARIPDTVEEVVAELSALSGRIPCG